MNDSFVKKCDANFYPYWRSTAFVLDAFISKRALVLNPACVAKARLHTYIHSYTHTHIHTHTGKRCRTAPASKLEPKKNLSINTNNIRGAEILLYLL